MFSLKAEIHNFRCENSKEVKLCCIFNIMDRCLGHLQELFMGVDFFNVQILESIKFHV